MINNVLQILNSSVQEVTLTESAYASGDWWYVRYPVYVQMIFTIEDLMELQAMLIHVQHALKSKITAYDISLRILGSFADKVTWLDSKMQPLDEELVSDEDCPRLELKGINVYPGSIQFTACVKKLDNTELFSERISIDTINDLIQKANDQ